MFSSHAFIQFAIWVRCPRGSKVDARRIDSLWRMAIS